MMDFNGAEEQREGGLIPADTIAAVHMTVRPGQSGDGGWLKRSKDGGSMAMDCEFTVIDGPFAKRKFWSLMTVEGTTDGHAKAAAISGSRLRGILESAKGIRPDDESEVAKNARRANPCDFDGLRFIAKVGIERGKDGYKDKNSLEAAITPDRKAWVKVEQIQKTNDAGVSAAVAALTTTGTGKPAWATT